MRLLVIALVVALCIACQPVDTPTRLPTHTPAPTPTYMPLPTSTPTPTLTPIPSPTPDLDATVEAKLAATVEAMPTPTSTPTPSPTPTSTPTPSPTPTSTPTPSPTPTSTPTPSPTPTSTPTPSPTPTSTPSPTPTPPPVLGLGFTRQHLESQFGEFGYTFREASQLRDGRAQSKGEGLILEHSATVYIYGPSDNVSKVTLMTNGPNKDTGVMGFVTHLFNFTTVLFPNHYEEVRDWTASTVIGSREDGEASETFYGKVITYSNYRRVLGLAIISVEPVP